MNWTNNPRFWEIEKERMMMDLTEHEMPITSLIFCHNFEYMVSATEEDLVIWKLSCREEAQKIREEEDLDEIRSRYKITAV